MHWSESLLNKFISSITLFLRPGVQRIGTPAVNVIHRDKQKNIWTLSFRWCISWNGLLLIGRQFTYSGRKSGWSHCNFVLILSRTLIEHFRLSVFSPRRVIFVLIGLLIFINFAVLILKYGKGLTVDETIKAGTSVHRKAHLIHIQLTPRFLVPPRRVGVDLNSFQQL